MIAGLSVWLVITCCGLAAIGATVQGAMGFGMGMLTSALLTLIDEDFVPGAILIAVIPLSIGVAVRERSRINRQIFLWAIIARVPGILVGAAALHYLSKRGLSIAVSVAVLVAVAVSLTRWRIEPTHHNLAVAGLASGFMGTVTSVGGPPMAIAYQYGDVRVRQATLAAYFGVGSILSVLILSIDGELGRRQWQLSLVLLPGVLVGIPASRWLVRHLDMQRARPIILAMSTASALLLLGQQL